PSAGKPGPGEAVWTPPRRRRGAPAYLTVTGGCPFARELFRIDEAYSTGAVAAFQGRAGNGRGGNRPTRGGARRGQTRARLWLLERSAMLGAMLSRRRVLGA